MTTLAIESPRSVLLNLNGLDVFFDENRLVCLTDMWKAAGSPENKEPQQWSRYAGSDFIAFVSANVNVGKSPIYKTRRGKGVGGTYAHWQIALAYAKYLSHEIHAQVNQAFKEWSEEKADPGLKMERAIKAYRRLGKSEDWIETRFKGINQRNILTATMADHNCKNNGRYDNAFAEGTRAISLKVLGATPKEIKIQRGLPKNAATRNHLDRHELIRLYFAESEAEQLIKRESLDGNVACVDACRRAGDAVKSAVQSLRGSPGARPSRKKISGRLLTGHYVLSYCERDSMTQVRSFATSSNEENAQ